MEKLAEFLICPPVPPLSFFLPLPLLSFFHLFFFFFFFFSSSLPAPVISFRGYCDNHLHKESRNYGSQLPQTRYNRNREGRGKAVPAEQSRLCFPCHLNLNLLARGRKREREREREREGGRERRVESTSLLVAKRTTSLPVACSRPPVFVWEILLPPSSLNESNC